MPPHTRPVFVVIAGPNGAGKTSLYERVVKAQFPDAEFVNADRLAQEKFGHPAATPEESAVGQQLAEARRRVLMERRQPLVSETTFSHPSKLQLVQEAKSAGYRVLLYHVNLRNADLAVMRVASRVQKGGHPVPEDRTRNRYERNAPLIREAALLADRAYVFDNSELARPHRQVLQLHHGKALYPDNVPSWARELYARELADFSPAQVNAPAASFAAATALTEAFLGPGAQTYIARNGATYSGRVIGKTGGHVVQQIGPSTTVAHFSNRLDREVDVGQILAIKYPHGKGTAKVADQLLIAASPANRARAEAFLTKPAREAVHLFPELASAYAALRYTELKASAKNPQEASKLIDTFKLTLATRIEQGLSLPEVLIRKRSPKRDPSRER